MRKDKHVTPADGTKGKKGTAQAAESKGNNQSASGAEAARRKSIEDSAEDRMTKGESTGQSYRTMEEDPDDDRLMPGDLEEESED